MKKIYSVFLCVTLVVMLNGCTGCKEVNTLVNLTPPNGIYDQLVLDTTFLTATFPAAQPKNVLIEDFTGEKCDNCPRAQARGVTVVETNPGRVSVLGIQCAPPLDNPYFSSFDLRTKHGDDLLGLEASNVTGLPTGDVDRKIYSGNPNSLISDFIWPSTTTSELALPTIANIDSFSKSYDPAGRIFSLKQNVTFTKASTDTFYYSAAIIESGMVGLQLTPTNVDSHFVFQHVLRKMIEPWNGLNIANGPAAGKTCRVSFSTILPSNWVADSCRVVTFVHRRGAKNDVEQVKETTIK